MTLWPHDVQPLFFSSEIRDTEPSLPFGSKSSEGNKKEYIGLEKKDQIGIYIVYQG